LGAYVLRADRYDAFFLRAQKIRTRVIDDFRQAFGQYDVLLCPTVSAGFPRAGGAADCPVAERPARACSQEAFTASASLAGLPAISLPWGRDAEGLPFGVQVIGPGWAESLTLRVAHGIEELAAAGAGRPAQKGGEAGVCV